jgi:hypothetical protein
MVVLKVFEIGRFYRDEVNVSLGSGSLMRSLYLFMKNVWSGKHFDDRKGLNELKRVRS